MPTGPKGEKRPADVIGNVVNVMRIATGQEPRNSTRETSGGRIGIACEAAPKSTGQGVPLG